MIIGLDLQPTIYKLNKGDKPWLFSIPQTLEQAHYIRDTVTMK